MLKTFQNNYILTLREISSRSFFVPLHWVPSKAKFKEWRKGTVVNDIQREKNKDILIQDNGNIIVRGSNGRVHVLSPDGQRHITTLSRTNKNVQDLIRQGKYNYATEEQAKKIINMYK